MQACVRQRCVLAAAQVGGHPQEKDTFARICGYVEQSDIHSPRVSLATHILLATATGRAWRLAVAARAWVACCAWVGGRLPTSLMVSCWSPTTSLFCCADNCAGGAGSVCNSQVRLSLLVSLVILWCRPGIIDYSWDFTDAGNGYIAVTVWQPLLTCHTCAVRHVVEVVAVSLICLAGCMTRVRRT